MSRHLTCFATPVPGFVVGHAGLLQALAMLLVAYVILALTVLSVCAIATNGAVRGGGAYCILNLGGRWSGLFCLMGFFFLLCQLACGNLVLHQGSNLCPLPWKR